jgi:putative membrane-bound dehydrogenase-like protein
MKLTELMNTNPLKYIKKHHFLLAILVLFIAQSCQKKGDGPAIDREYVLEAYISGYIGVGGEIDGIRNPTLTARQGETVKITMINGETMTHDIVLEQMGVESDAIVEEGTSTSIIFTAEQNDTYYCSVPGHKEAGMVGSFELIDSEENQPIVEGVPPVINGEKGNFSFENGDITHWQTSGEAFSEQPLSGSSNDYFEQDMSLRPQGNFYVSSGGSENHQWTGEMSSSSFEVTHPYASFYVSGGALEDTRVEVVHADTDTTIFQITGNNHERLRPVVVDLQAVQGENIYVKLIDQETGIFELDNNEEDIWAHINFDNFEFHDERPQYVDELKKDEIITLPPYDPIINAGLSAEETVEEMQVPEGFSVQVAAAEPEIVRPIALAFDDRGRLWIAEAHSYPVREPEGEGKDRILIFEDTTGDGKLDKRTVFMEGLNLVSGMEIGHGGLWVGAAPYLMYIPINEQGNKPAGEPEILLDGWGYQDTHETLSSFRWGPDGWLYGTVGITTQSSIGKPGTPDEEREDLNVGTWRYHPIEHEFEVYSRGISNMWGLDFNKYGHMFLSANILPHLWHVVQGGWYRRQFGNHDNPYIYDDIKTIADHVHWVGDTNLPELGNGRSNSKGGGHSHAGAMFYLGADHWPEKYRDYIFMNNIHGARVNADRVDRKGSGYVGIHQDDFLLTNDAWSQWLDFRYGPGGSVYAIDWYDKNQCHHTNEAIHDKTLGRIFNIRHEKDNHVDINLREKSSLELVDYQLATNEWYVIHARKILQERGPDQDVHTELRNILDDNPDVTRKLRALWALHVTKGMTDQNYIELLDHENEYIRAWAIKLLAEDKQVPQAGLDRFAEMAMSDESQHVRLYLASALQRLKPSERWAILEGLVQHEEDSNDHNIPLMIWYSIEQVIDEYPERALEVAENSKLPRILAFTVRRVEDMNSDQSAALLENIDRKKFSD